MTGKEKMAYQFTLEQFDREAREFDNDAAILCSIMAGDIGSPAMHAEMIDAFMAGCNESISAMRALVCVLEAHAEERESINRQTRYYDYFECQQALREYIRGDRTERAHAVDLLNLHRLPEFRIPV